MANNITQSNTWKSNGFIDILTLKTSIWKYTIIGITVLNIENTAATFESTHIQ